MQLSDWKESLPKTEINLVLNIAFLHLMFCICRGILDDIWQTKVERDGLQLKANCSSHIRHLLAELLAASACRCLRQADHHLPVSQVLSDYQRINEIIHVCYHARYIWCYVDLLFKSKGNMNRTFWTSYYKILLWSCVNCRWKIEIHGW